jgi:cell division septation protein DedD
MQVDIEIGNHIAALLYTNEVVSIPGLGSFVTAYQPAEIDPVQGELSPPSKALKFDKNLAVDDGLLIKHISEEEQISMADAERLVNAYVEQLKEAIEKRELVSFSGLGRLYKDYEGQFQFLADGTNFNTDSYGLPNVQFFPISRLQQTTAHKGTANTAKAGYAGKKVADTKKAGLNKGLLAAMGLAVLVAGIAIYVLLFQGASSGSTVENAQTVPTSRVNVKPTMDSSFPESGSAAIDDEEDRIDDVEYADEDDMPEEIVDTESPTIAPEQDYFVIIIGSFGNTENVERLVERIYNAGYEPYTEQSGKLTKVGIQKTYTDRSEIRSTLKDVQKEFSKDAKVYKD